MHHQAASIDEKRIAKRRIILKRIYGYNGKKIEKETLSTR